MGHAIRTANNRLRSNILKAGKAEFMKSGFTGASLRKIAGVAGVTTGAIYTYFVDKSALFDALVEQPAEELRRQFLDKCSLMDETLTQDIAAWHDFVDVNPDWLVHLLYEDFDAFRLLVCHAGGTRYEDYIDSLVKIETESTIRYIRHLLRHGIIDRGLDDELVHVTASTYFAGIFEPIAHDMPKAQALRYMRTLEEFYSAGWKKILKV